MAAEQVRVRISLSEGEFEIDAIKEYVEEFRNVIDSLLKALAESGPSTSAKRGHVRKEVDEDGGISFPEALYKLSSSASGAEKMLVAARFAQKASSDNTFSTAEANKMLTDQAIKLANPSQTLANMLKSKRIFKVGKRFRLSQIGDESVDNLIAK